MLLLLLLPLLLLHLPQAPGKHGEDKRRRKGRRRKETHRGGGAQKEGSGEEEEEEMKRNVTQRKEHSQEVGKKRVLHAWDPVLNRHLDTETEREEIVENRRLPSSCASKVCTSKSNRKVDRHSVWTASRT